MSENLKTIRELAEEFNVSKQAVRKRFTEEFRGNYVETVTSNGVKTLVVKYAGYMLLKQHFSASNDTGNEEGNNNSNRSINDSSIVKIFEQQLVVKDKQLENKDNQISQMQNLLDQQQRLALQDKKLLEEYKSEIQALKALTAQSVEKEEDTNKKSLDNISNHANSKPKKWWPFIKKGRNSD